MAPQEHEEGGGQGPGWHPPGYGRIRAEVSPILEWRGTSFGSRATILPVGALRETRAEGSRGLRGRQREDVGAAS
jgi:hypothetical protein